MKIAFIVQRCGVDVFGGAEALTLQVAKRLSLIHDVEIITTKAHDAGTWKNHYSKDIEQIDNLKIRRFPVDKLRDPKFVSISKYLETNPNDMKKCLEFLDANGPVCTSLINFLKNNHVNYDLLIFVGYSYWQTYNGLQVAPEKSLLLSTAHDESWIYFKIYEKVFSLPAGYLFLTNAEKQFVHKHFKTINKPYQIVGHGVDENISQLKSKRPRIALPKNYLLYVGRISAGKGCQELVDYHNRYTRIKNSDMTLVLLGNQEHHIQNCNALILESLSDEEKFYVMQHCDIFIMPSKFESLNIACLEAWLFGKPVIVNGESEVLKEHCVTSNGGLFYTNYEEFSEILDLIRSDDNLTQSLSNNGKSYVKSAYNWDVTVSKYDKFFQTILNEKIN